MKSKGVGVVFKVCGGFVVVLRGGCKGFGEVKSILCG